MNKKQLKNTEWSILICTIILILIGLFALYSASIASNLEAFKKQIMWVLIGLPMLIGLMFIDYKLIARFSIVFYIISIVLLIVVLLTSAINGATSWFNLGAMSIQPAEFAKIAFVIFLSNIMSGMSRNDINRPLKLLMILAITAIPVLLIILQPDYGTAMAYIFALTAMLYVAGLKKRYIITAILLIVIAVPLLYFFVLPAHAKARIDVYLNPYLDPRGAGYNIIQSKLAIGAGRLVGQGWLNGTQTHLGFLYPKTTDFIFAVIGEELGFVTCVTVIVLYIILITRSVNIAKTAGDDLGAYIAAGIVRNIHFSCSREHRNDNGTITNYRCSTSIY